MTDKEAMEALLNHKILVSEDGEIVSLDGDMVVGVFSTAFEYYEIDDDIELLVRLHDEGAKIEVKRNGKWEDLEEVNVSTLTANKEARIKGGISLQSWFKHKDTIIAWWDGATVKTSHSDMTVLVANPGWEVTREYGIARFVADPGDMVWVSMTKSWSKALQREFLAITSEHKFLCWDKKKTDTARWDYMFYGGVGYGSRQRP